MPVISGHSIQQPGRGWGESWWGVGLIGKRVWRVEKMKMISRGLRRAVMNLINQPSDRSAGDSKLFDYMAIQNNCNRNASFL